ncbi:MAG: hypothetical protein EPO13_06690 [Actinomycetota bacterium]|nr:MAG: hypothetical protein EPO13_06690 [Actinomycetota bacterium]
MSATETSTAVGVRTGVHPRVNLLPPGYQRRTNLRRAKLIAGGTVALAVVVVGAGYVMGNGAVADAQTTLDASQATNSQLKSQARTYAAVPATYAAVADAQAQLTLAMGQDVRWSSVLNDLTYVTPPTSSITSMTATLAKPPVGTAAAPAATGNQAPTVPSVGAVTFQVDATTLNTIADWLDGLGKLPTMSDVFFSQAAFTTDAASGLSVWKYGSTANLTEAALSHRYDGTKTGS